MKSDPQFSPARKGDFVAVRLEPRDGQPSKWAIRRVVKTKRDGAVTHVCRSIEWQTAKADSSTDLRGQWVILVRTIGPFARNPHMALLADFSIYNSPYEDIKDFKAAIQYAAKHGALPEEA